MAVLKTPDASASPAASLLDQIVALVDPKSPANINYVKARMAIEAAGLARSPKRELKMVVISYLKGEVRHPDTAGSVKAPNQVVFADGSRARF
jgi:hypothetical protein